MTTVDTIQNTTCKEELFTEDNVAVPCIFIDHDVPIRLIGPAADWFKLSRDDNDVVIHPAKPLPARCLIKPAAMFIQDRGLAEMNVVMGRLLFLPGSTQPQRYQPFTRDPYRQFREVILATEPAPDDALLNCQTRWVNNMDLARRLLSTVHIAWSGIAQKSIEQMVNEEPWLEPLEGCLLHALTCYTHAGGKCVVEIGSLRGQSLTILARALTDAVSDSRLISIDPHRDQPLHLDQVRLSLAKTGQQHRLIQYQCTSDEARRFLKPESASLLFIDGDHAYQQVVADFQNYRDILAPGGCLVFHDYGYGNHNGKEDVVPGVRQAVDEYVLPADDFRPLLLGHTLFAFIKQK